MEFGFVELGQSSCGHPECGQDYRIEATPGSAFSIGAYSTTTRTLAGSSPRESRMAVPCLVFVAPAIQQ